MPRIRITGITVGIKGRSRSLVSVDLVNPPCRDLRWKINAKEMEAEFSFPLELSDSQVMIMRIDFRGLLSSSSKEISISAGDLLTQSKQTINFDQITVKVETESIAVSQPTEPDSSAVIDGPLQPMTTVILTECPRFRILVIGKSGAGKSSLINTAFRVQQDDGQANVANMAAGVHDINREIICKANQQFVLHDSQGFEGGEANNLAIVQTFLKDRGASVDISEQVHAVWLCLPIPTTGGRILETGIEEFLKMKTSGKLGKMPIIAVFTKYDFLLTRTRRLGSKDPGKDADKVLETTCIAPLRKLVKDSIPHSTVSNKQGHEKTLQDLIELTKAEVGKNLPEIAQIVLGIAQQISPKGKIESSIAVGKRRHWKSLGTSISFFGKKLKECLEVIHVDVVKVWAIEDPHNHLGSDEFQALMVGLAGDLSDNRAESAGKSLVAGLSAAVGLVSTTGPAAPVLVPAAVAVVLAKWVYDIYSQIPDILMRLMAYVVNLILVMQLLFLVLAGEKTKISKPLIMCVVEVYRDSIVKAEVHARIKTYVTESGALNRMGRDHAFETVDELLKRYCENTDIVQLKDDVLSAHGLAAGQSDAR
ncbi:hypothetical protein FIBSPDRAFT_832298 [Athelia psychrophila]|uniref:G domain-containing protein n=1 Tax=Athelia psychrophila TaxID=1759441 RepID=A0A166EL83_9AGAM|nr:hypothetical protein FIBSPDRAFT_832298 [Fibularhizoctonia sp. CBS 109695]